MKVCIAGGGKVGMYLAQSLLAHHHKVTIICLLYTSDAADE